MTENEFREAREIRERIMQLKEEDLKIAKLLNVRNTKFSYIFTVSVKYDEEKKFILEEKSNDADSIVNSSLMECQRRIKEKVKLLEQKFANL